MEAKDINHGQRPLFVVALASALLFTSLALAGPELQPVGGHQTTSVYANQTRALWFETFLLNEAAGKVIYQNETRWVSFASSAAPVQELPIAANPIPVVKWSEVKPKLESGAVLLIDARPATQYQINHIPGAISAPSDTSDGDLQAMMSRFRRDLPIIVYCGSSSCQLSRNFAIRLLALGFTHVRDMAGGMEEYLREEPEAVRK